MNVDLTVSEAIADPLIALVRRAYGIDNEAFASMLDNASREQAGRLMLRRDMQQTEALISAPRKGRAKPTGIA